MSLIASSTTTALPSSVMPFPEKLVWTYGLILFVLGIFLSIVNTPYFDQIYTIEDGLLEWITVLALGTTSAICLRRLATNHRTYSALQRTMIGVAALFFLFGTGEEISWGQRLLGITSPEFFEANNAQGETNLHNLIVGETKINKLVFGKLVALSFLVYLGVLTPLHRKGGKIAAWLDAWAIPIPTRWQWWGYLGLIIGVEGVIHLLSETPRRGELTEFGASLLVMLTVLYPANAAVFEPKNATT